MQAFKDQGQGPCTLKTKAKDLGHKAKAKDLRCQDFKDLDFGLKDQGQGLTSLDFGGNTDHVTLLLRLG